MSRRTVLFIEDEPAVRGTYERFFADRYELLFAPSGAEALTLLGQHTPDAAVLDLRLPDTDGVELLKRIHQLHPQLPVIIATAYSSIEPQLEVLDLRHAGYLVKPFELDALRDLIDAAV